MKIGDLPQKRWFSWSLVALLLMANVISYQLTNNYFKQVTNPSAEVEVGANYLGSGNKVIDWARDILRFFKNP